MHRHMLHILTFGFLKKSFVKNATIMELPPYPPDLNPNLRERQAVIHVKG